LDNFNLARKICTVEIDAKPKFQDGIGIFLRSIVESLVATLQAVYESCLGVTRSQPWLQPQGWVMFCPTLTRVYLNKD